MEEVKIREVSITRSWVKDNEDVSIRFTLRNEPKSWVVGCIPWDVSKVETGEVSSNRLQLSQQIGTKLTNIGLPILVHPVLYYKILFSDRPDEKSRTVIDL